MNQVGKRDFEIFMALHRCENEEYSEKNYVKSSILYQGIAFQRSSVGFSITFSYKTQILNLFRWKVTKNFPYSFLETYSNFRKFFWFVILVNFSKIFLEIFRNNFRDFSKYFSKFSKKIPKIVKNFNRNFFGKYFLKFSKILLKNVQKIHNNAW